VPQVEAALKRRPAAAVDDLVATARAAAHEWAADCRPLAHTASKTKIAAAMIARAVKGAAGR
jgi:hypothetical protein